MKPFAACVHYADPSFHGKLPALKTEDCKWQYSDTTDTTDIMATTVIMGTTATTATTAIMATTVTMAITGTTPKARQVPPFSAAPLA
jgi:hypothetical protein